ncbi:anaerobic sulfatase maturase [Synechococcus elongatus]|uniref:anaerobic sulfatase maturase n=1 Tax=Synechococcus elongatus TaxID=32046 RepID=UPI000F7F5C19|nr:anaerobic sulfatase maturase [Synechococcus elongatus]
MAHFHVMAKPTGPICNLDCEYCFYLDKEQDYPQDHSFQIAEAKLERYIQNYIAAQSGEVINFAWQGGEPTLLGVKFFEKVVALQKRYAKGKVISNSIQTNGTLLNDRWGKFLKEHHFLVGLSLDGPRELHDRYRVDKKQKPSFDRVMQGLVILKKYQVDFNILCVVHRHNAQHPQLIYSFFKEIGARFIQFIPLVDRVDDQVAEWSVDPKAYGDFLIQIFNQWVRTDIGQVFIQIFDVALGNWMGLGSSLCLFAETCGQAIALEHDGKVYSCDHYVTPQHQIGDIEQQSFLEMLTSDQQIQFGQAKQTSLPNYCRNCEVKFACQGECPRNRFAATPEGEPGLNYLCEGYRAFFNYIDPYMQIMAALLKAGQPAADLMSLITPTGLNPQLLQSLRQRKGESRSQMSSR